MFNAASASSVSGIIPSPHGLSIGGSEPSASVTENPLWRAAIAAANPAGPPPTTNTSVFSFCANTHPAFDIAVSLALDAYLGQIPVKFLLRGALSSALRSRTKAKNRPVPRCFESPPQMHPTALRLPQAVARPSAP